MELYGFQEESLEALRTGFRSGARTQILCLPTGAGKTVVAGAMIRSAVAKGGSVAFVCDRIALVTQTSMRLSEAGIGHGILAGELTRAQTLPVQVCSAQTIATRGWGRKEPGLVVVDEAHTQYKSTVDLISKGSMPVVGLSATPLTRGLGRHYERVVSPVTTRQLIEGAEGVRKVLVPLRVRIAVPIDMEGAPTNSSGEWTAATAEERASPITGDIVAEWQNQTREVFGGPVKTLCFSATVAHGEELCEEWRRKGFDFRHVTYRDKAADKARSIEEFRRGGCDGLVSVDALAKGFDVRDVLCLVSARPYRKSLAAHIQQLGRAMRISPGKDFALVLDHAGNYLRHAEAAERFWRDGIESLDDGEIEKARKGGETERSERLCGGCESIMPPGAPVCPWCGWKAPRRKADIERRAGTMVEYTGGMESRHGDIWPHVCRHALDRRPGDPAVAMKMAKAQYRDLTGRWPEWGRPFEPGETCAPDIEQALEASHRAYVNRRRREAYARRRAS